MYHKIAPDSPTMWWVQIDEFYRQMCELRGKDVVYLDDYDPNNPNHVVITFDGVYENVHKHALPILKKFGYPFELFITTNYIGKDNQFDRIDKRTGLKTNEPITNFASLKQLKELVKNGGRLEWHTKSHPNLTKIKQEDLKKELNIPKKLKNFDKNGFNWIGYPHGEFNDKVIKLSEKLFKGGLSVIQGNDKNPFKFNRLTVINDTKISNNSIGVIIPSYNYGQFLVEAVESVLNQTRPADKILIIDDCSTDNTQEIGEKFARDFPENIVFHKNKNNLGIVKNFNKAVSLLKTDYITFLGADNRFVSNYLEETSRILDENNNIAIAYTDFALFGARASEMFDRMPHNRRGKIVNNQFFIVNFPDFSKNETKKLKEINFMHGSSMYRYDAYKMVGGYLESKKAEDHNLFHRIIENGWKAKRVPKPILEYRQHSKDQTNSKIIYQAELKFYKDEYHKIKFSLLGKIYRWAYLSRKKRKILSKIEYKLRVIKVRSKNIIKDPKSALKRFIKKVK